MNRRGLLTHRGKLFRTSTIQTILANRKTYEGFFDIFSLNFSMTSIVFIKKSTTLSSRLALKGTLYLDLFRKTYDNNNQLITFRIFRSNIHLNSFIPNPWESSGNIFRSNSLINTIGSLNCQTI